jgi:glutamate synthase (NADPH/NADH) large chain
MSGGVAYVYDPEGRFSTLCNKAMVDLEPVGAPSPDMADRPRQRSVSVADSGMGDMLRFDAERLHVLLERHHLHTGSLKAREVLDGWDDARRHFVKVMPKDYRRALVELQADAAVESVAAE